jgi:hypothetical protein
VACDFAIDPQPPESWRADAVIRHFDELLPALEGLGSGRP